MKKLYYCLLLIACLNTHHATAQEADSKWHFLVEPYMMFPNMKGEVAVGVLPAAEVDSDAGDIFSNLKFGAMLYMEASNNDWSISTDFIFMDLEKDIKTNALITGGSSSAKQLVVEIAGLKRVSPWFEVGLAARVVSLKSGLDINIVNGNSQSGAANETWVDPVLVLRSQGVLKEKWLLQFRGDFGGPVGGSDFTCQFQANVGYKFSKLFSTTIGYRYINIDYDAGEGADRFLYDIDTYGPVVRLGFHL